LQFAVGIQRLGGRPWQELIGILGWQGLHGSEAGGTGGLGAMTHREHLAQADRFIAECKNRIARQREIIATGYENGHSTDIPVSMLRALEENLRSFERHRHLILDQLKNADRQRLARTASQSSVRN
jgi:hypothetical protein